jgi:hypothetical protein
MPNTLDSVYKYIADTMRERGFTATVSSNEATKHLNIITGSHTKYAGLRFRADKNNFVIKRNTGGSGYVNMLSHRFEWSLSYDNYDQDIVNIAYARVDTILLEYDQRVIQILEMGYPQPFEFTPHIITKGGSLVPQIQSFVGLGPLVIYTDPDEKDLRCILATQLREAVVYCLVTINHGCGTVNTRPEALAHPNTECWFLMSVVGHANAAGNIITNSTCYIPVSYIAWHEIKHGTSKVVKMTPDFGKATLRTLFSVLDQQLITAAITAWCQKYPV